MPEDGKELTADGSADKRMKDDKEDMKKRNEPKKRGRKKKVDTTAILGYPSRVWYVSHIFFWVVSGLICYLVWRDDNRQAAKKHLIYSLWMPIVVWTAVTVLTMFLVPEDVYRSLLA